MGITSDWQHGFMHAYNFCNHVDGFMDGKYKSQQVNKKKDDKQRNVKKKAK